MNIFPAIDLIDGCAVRLEKGDYQKKTVYSENPLEVAQKFEKSGAKFLHIVDLDGAKEGTSPNFEVIKKIAQNTSLFIEVGGGIRSLETISRYINCGVGRVILGTAAITNPKFLKEAIAKYTDKVAVGVDIKDGMVAIKGWTEVSQKSCFDFCDELENFGVKTVICTDISKDGMLSGTNIELYKQLCSKYSISFIASGGVSTIEDVKNLKALNIYGAIVGKALYTGNISLEEALKVCEE